MHLVLYATQMDQILCSAQICNYKVKIILLVQSTVYHTRMYNVMNSHVLLYSPSFNPSAVIDLATLTGAIDVATRQWGSSVLSSPTHLHSGINYMTLWY